MYLLFCMSLSLCVLLYALHHALHRRDVRSVRWSLMPGGRKFDIKNTVKLNIILDVSLPILGGWQGAKKLYLTYSYFLEILLKKFNFSRQWIWSKFKMFREGTFLGASESDLMSPVSREFFRAPSKRYSRIHSFKWRLHDEPNIFIA